VVLILAPWNYPFNLFINPLVAAVAAGNCVMLRPSDKVRQTARFLKELVEAVFPEEEAAVFLGDRFLASVTLELGGKSPAIVDETADVAAAAWRRPS
jgi:aldehyde dehydrogenase (NAD+)